MIKKDSETRNINCEFEVREVVDGNNKQIHIQGYALTYGTLSENLGGFRETIASGALDECDMSDVIFTFEHDISKILARNSKNNGVGSLILTIDEKGLFFDAVPTDTTYSRDLIENLKNGIVNKCSFIFNVDWSDSKSQKWDWDDGNRGYDFRTIYKLKSISDVSIVVFPAYNDTEINIYSRAKKECSNESQIALELRKKQIENEIELI